MSDAKIYYGKTKGRQQVYLLIMVLVSTLPFLWKIQGSPYFNWFLASFGFYIALFVLRVFRSRGRVYWVKTDGDALQVYDSYKNTSMTYSINEMRRIDWYEDRGIKVYLKSKNIFKRSVLINTALLENRRELKLWVKALQHKIELRNKATKLQVKEKKLRDRFSIHRDLTVRDNIFVGLSDDAYKKIQRYVKGAVCLWTGLVMSFICPFGFIVVMVAAICMNIRSSGFAGEHPLLFENPSLTFGRNKKELKIMALSDERIAGVFQFYYAKKTFKLCSFLPVIAFATLVFALIMFNR